MRERVLICIVAVLLVLTVVQRARSLEPLDVMSTPAGPPPAGGVTKPPAGLPANGLVALWRGEGNAGDSAGANHARGKSEGVSYAAGRVGRCFKFDGKTGYVDFGSPKTLQITGDQTLAMWVRPDSLEATSMPLCKAPFSGEGTIILSGADGGLMYRFGQRGAERYPYFTLMTRRTDDPKPIAEMYHNHTNKTYPKATGTGATIQAGRWTHIATVRDFTNKRIRIYINGALAAECATPYSSAVATGSPLLLGRCPYKSRVHHYSGLIDEVGVWNRALTAAEIRAMVGAVGGARGIARGLVGYWPANGDAKDAVGDNHGKPVRSPVLHLLGRLPPGVRMDAPAAIRYTEDRHGAANAAFDFRNVWDFINVGNSKSLDTDDAFTLSAWAKPSGHGRKLHLITKYGDESVSADYSFEIEADGRARLLVCNGGAEDVIYSKAKVPAKKWTHVAATFDQGALRLFLNGKLEATLDSVKIKHTTRKKYPHDEVTIGSYWKAQPLDNIIDDVAIWNRALTAAEVGSIFKAPDLGSLLAYGSAPVVTRLGQGDRLDTAGDDVLIGTILNDKYVLKTAFGELDIPAGSVIGLAPVEMGKIKRTWVLLADGQAVCGELAAKAIKFKLSIGSELSVPLEKVRECGYAISEARPAHPLATGGLVELIDGQRLSWVEADTELQFRTAHGPLSLPAGSLLSLDAVESGHRAQLVNGSTISGKLTAETLSVKLQLSSVAKIATRRIARLVWPERVRAGEAATELTLRNGDRLLGDITDKRLTIRTEFGDMVLGPANVLKMTFDPAGQLKAKTWDGGSVTGKLVEEALTVALGPDGPEVKVKVAAIAAITRSSALPPADVVRKIEKLIAKLGAESFEDREDATNELIGIGAPAKPLLKKHRNDSDPEVRHRIKRILEAIGGEGEGNANTPRPGNANREDLPPRGILLRRAK